jgi:hypothetical protein
MKRLLSLLLVILAGCAASLPEVDHADLSFALMGDTPYNAAEVRALDALIDDLNAHELAFVVHVGDITGGRGPCTDAWFEARKRQFQNIRHPFVLIPGDNDWLDCHRTGFDPLERLNKLRELFLSGDRSLGRRSIPLERQSSDPRFPEYREHMRWIAGNVVFIGLNVQGSNNNLGRTKQMDEEYRHRMAAVLAWLEDSMALAEQRRLAGAVILIQANPGFESPPRPLKGAPDGFAEFRDALRKAALRFGKPMLLVHGDTHVYQQNQPLIDPSSGKPVVNFFRVEVPGSPQVRWLKAGISRERAEVFSITPAPSPSTSP